MTDKAIPITALRCVAVERVIAGLTLLTAPEAVSRLVAPRAPATPPAWLTRLLGARLLAQGIVQYTRPGCSVALGGAVVDVAHACSMVPIAVSRPAYRRVAAASAIEAASAAIITGLAAGRMR